VKTFTRDQMFEAMNGYEDSDFYAVLDIPKSGCVDRDDENKQRTLGTKGGAECVNGRNNQEEVSDTDEEERVVPSVDQKLLRGKVLHNLREMLRVAKLQGFDHIVRWLPNGKAFKVYNRVAFQKHIMKEYFQTTRLTHLSDLLRTYGFIRLTSVDDDERNAYYHRFFQRDRPELCRKLTKQQMFDSMKEFREEQKRLKETSWSLLAADVEIDVDVDDGGDKKMPSRGPKINPIVVAAAEGVSEGPRESELLQQNSDPPGVDTNPTDHGASRAEPSMDESLADSNRPFPKDAANDTANSFFSQMQDDAINYLDSSTRHDDSNQYYFDAPYQMGPKEGVVAQPQNTTDTITDPNSIDCPTNAKPTQAQATPKKRTQVTNTEIANNALTQEDNQAIRDNKSTPYLQRIIQMLEESEHEGGSSIVSWVTHGRAFRIHDEKLFETKIRMFNEIFFHWWNTWSLFRCFLN
jgi:hypothetical protein